MGMKTLHMGKYVYLPIEHTQAGGTHRDLKMITFD